MGIFDGFNPSGQGTMFGSNETNSTTNFYEFLEKEHGLTDEGMFDLTAKLGDKEKAPELIKAFLEYSGQKPEQNKVDQMMGNSGFIMGLSLMQQAAGGKNIGAALLPAAQGTQAFMTNQELRDQRKQLIKDKETGRILEISKLSSDMETAETNRVSANIVNTMNLQKIEEGKYQVSRREDTIKSIKENKNLTNPEKEQAINNWEEYGKVDDYSRYNATSDTFAQVEKKVKIKQTFLESIIPFYGSGDDKEAARTQIVKDIAGKATEIARQKYESGAKGYTTPEVKDADINEAREKYIKDGKIKLPNTLSRFFNQDMSVFNTGEFTLTGKRMGGEVEANEPVIIGEDGPEVFVPETDGNIISNPKTAGGYTWEDAIIDNSEMLKKIKQSGGAEEAKKALKKFRPDLYI